MSTFAETFGKIFKDIGIPMPKRHYKYVRIIRHPDLGPRNTAWEELCAKLLGDGYGLLVGRTYTILVRIIK